MQRRGVEGGVVEVKAQRGRGGEGRGGVLPGLFGLEFDRLSLSPNLSISPSSLPLSPFLSSPALLQSGGKEGQTEIRADRMMECAPLPNRIRGEKEGEEVGADVAFKTNKGK